MLQGLDTLDMNYNLVVLVGALVAILIMIFLKIKKLTGIKENKYFTYVSLVLYPMLLAGALMNISARMPVKNYFINSLFFLAIVLFFILLSLGLRPVLLVTTIVSFVLFVLNEEVFLLRSYPILPSDIYNIKTGLAVADNYGFWINLNIVRAFVVTVALCMFALFFIKKEKIHKKTALQYIVILVSLSGTLFALHEVGRDCKINDVFSVRYSQKNDGILLDFYKRVKLMNIREPENYSIEAVSRIKDNYQNQDGVLNEKPNVIVIMSEAFVNYNLVGNGDIGTEDNPYEFYDSLNENVIKGKQFVSVLGGGTCNTEFEFLTGCSLSFFPETSYPYMQFIHSNKDNLMTYFKTQGYDTLAIHPYYSSCWRREEVYKYFQVDDFISLEDMAPKMKKEDYIRKYISDSTAYETLIEQYEEKDENKKLFTFLVTMQNHGAYRYYENGFVNKVQSSTIDNDAFDQYLTIAKESDKALEKLITYFTDYKQPTIILLYGDHNPIFADQVYNHLLQGEPMSDIDKQMQKYEVPYLIWANYPLSNMESPDTSPNYLSCILKKAAGLPLEPWDKFRMEIMSQYPIITTSYVKDKEGEWLERDQVDNEKIKEYEAWQYERMVE